MRASPDLHGRSALVTGAGRRLGRAFAEALAAHGANIAVHYSGSSGGAHETVTAAQTHGVKAVSLQADLGNPEETAGLVGRAVEALGGVDYLVNSAAIFEPLGVLDASLEAWERHMGINLTAPFLLSQAFARHREGRPGAIVNILDWRALRPGADHFPYTISKAGLAAMTRSLALAFAPSIRVNGLALAAILPPSDATDAMEAPPGEAPISRWGKVEEVTHALLFLLAGPDFITGDILHLDGGRHLT